MPNPIEDNNKEHDDKLEVKATYDAKQKIAVASTSVEDRHGEKIDQTGWELKNFKKNPVMLWAHDHSEIAVGNARNIHIERKSGEPRLMFTPDFHDKTDTARALKELFEEGWLNSFSVGFIPKDFDGKESKYLKQELLEISAVNVPANPDARTMSYKTLVDKGFDKALAKEVTGMEEKDEETTEEVDETENETTEEPEKKMIGQFLKGALADEIEANDKFEKKIEKVREIQDVIWAFYDVYYDEDTPVEDFDKLVGELVTELGKLIGDTEEDKKVGDLKVTGFKCSDHGEIDPEPACPKCVKDESEQVLDKESNNTEDENSKDENTSSQVKTQDNKETSVAPDSVKETRAKQSLTKVISKASAKLLEEEKQKGSKGSVDQLKVIKRASEILSQRFKAEVKSTKKG